MYIEGRNAVAEALRAQVPITKIIFAHGARADHTLESIQKDAAKQGILCQTVPKSKLDDMSERGSHQGVMAKVGQFQFAQLQEVLDVTADQQDSLIIILDHITDPGNLGAIVRSAEVSGAAAVIVPTRRSVSITPAAWKAAAGALAHIPLVQVGNIAQTIEAVQKANYWVAGASEHATQLAWDAPLAGKIALVMGSEGQGLARLTKERCDFLVKLPQSGKVGSLNVAQAATALMYEVQRQCALLK